MAEPCRCSGCRLCEPCCCTATNPPGIDLRHEELDAAWNEAFAALRAAGLEADADHPVAARYRAASDEVNHSNRKRDWGIFSGQIRPRSSPQKAG